MPSLAAPPRGATFGSTSSAQRGQAGSWSRGAILRMAIVAIVGGWGLALVTRALVNGGLSPAMAYLLREDLPSSTKQTAGGTTGQLPRARPRPPDWDLDPMDYKKPRTFFDISIDGEMAGRIEFELYTKQSPRSAENFRALCTGEKGTVPDEEGREGRGLPLHFKGLEFYRVIDQFICQTGAPTESVFGGRFLDDPGGLLLKHNKKGLLSMANMGPDTNTAHFSIVVAPAPHLDGHYTIFGEVVSFSSPHSCSTCPLFP
eukprot:TRINITY_DN1155_c0_g1_i3.p1 TRINITY_DN1155_c0_g1~~TRINITY_DN1155_c0_g1_i3.p1  ORF type:complete len:259 (+),score=42.41 TRINITY_DN1155_c0_g1_i3:428-1204(+)